MVEDDDVAYLLLLDGVGTAITNKEEVTTAYVQTLGFDLAYPGLQLPTGLAIALNPRNGMFEGSEGRFVIEDIDDTLPQLFGVPVEDTEPLLSQVPAGTTALADANLFDIHIGTEKIGAAGERRRHSCVPSWEIGRAHLSEQQASATGATPSPVSASPVTWAGRRFCLYRLVKNSAGDWPDLNDAAERLATRVYWGTLTGQGEQDEKTWTLSCSGVESWPMGSLGATFTQQPIPIDVGVGFDENADEHVLIGKLAVVDLFTNLLPPDDANAYVYVDTHVDATSLSGAASYADVAAGFNTFLAFLANDATLGTALAAQDSGLEYRTGNTDGVHVLWDRDAGFAGIADKYSLRLIVCGSEKAWKVLGYDPAVQNSSIDPIENFGKFGLFSRPNGTSTAEAELIQWAIDYPNHWVGIFWSADSVAIKTVIEGGTGTSAEHSNNGNDWRQWPPIYSGGANTFDFNATNQLFSALTLDPLFLASSSAVPLPSDPDDPSSPLTIAGVGEVTHQGLVVFTGPYRDETNPEAEVEKITIPARVAWREYSDGSVTTNGSYPTLAIYDWPDPQLYGFEDKRPSLWAAWRNPPDGGEPHTVRSLLVLEHGTTADLVSYLLARMLASTGAAGGWFSDVGLTTPAYGLGGSPYLDVGPNDLGLTAGGVAKPTDADLSVYALGIPAEMIAVGSEVQASFQSALEQMADSDVYRAKCIVGKVVSARDVMLSLLAPFGWCLSLAGGRYGLFDPFTFEAPIGDTGAITIEDLAGEPGDPSSATPTQRLRKWAPIDRVKLQARLNPLTNSFARTETLRSPDQDSFYRAQSLEHAVNGAHMIHPQLIAAGGNWLSDWLERWRKICRWWSRQHFECSLTVHAADATEFFPGSVVTVTNEWLVNPAGQVYGITQAPGYVLSWELNAEDETVEISCIVDASTLRLYSTSARAIRYDPDEDGEGHRILVLDDYLGIRGDTGTLDVEGFAEPAYSTAGGNASIEVLALGSTWSTGIYGEVASVTAVPGGCWINLTGALTGADWNRDHHHIVVLRAAADQAAAWPFNVLAPIGDELGNYTGSTKSPQFKD